MELIDLSIEEKIGQKFMFGINSDNIDIVIDIIKKYCIGGVILYKKNYKNYKEMLSVIKRLKTANKGNKLPLLIAIDQEGGRVNRMPSEFKNIKNIYDVSHKNVDIVYDYGNITGKMLSSIGINMNFAPVIDLYEDGNKVLYKRCFYGNVDDVNKASAKYLKGIYDSGVIATVKHFPGHGASKFDSHFITPYVHDYEKVFNKHILPFENSIKNGIDAVMINHLVIRKLTSGLPASISPSFIKNYLRDKYSYGGVIITDEINMLARNIVYKFIYTKKAFESDSDIILVKLKSKRDVNIINKFVKIANSDSKYMSMIDSSVARIIKLKKKYNVNDSVNYDEIDVDLINKKIDKINSICL